MVIQLDDAAICDVFQNKYEELYNCVHYNVQEVEDLKREIDAELNHQLNSDFVIYINDVEEAIANLKLGKSDGEEGLVSDHFINGTMLLQVLITCLFNNCMLVHGVCPDTMSCGTMIPIPKDKRKSLDCSDNYRAITLGSIVSKILDSVILLKEKSALSNLTYSLVLRKKIIYYSLYSRNVRNNILLQLSEE